MDLNSENFLFPAVITFWQVNSYLSTLLIALFMTTALSLVPGEATEPMHASESADNSSVTNRVALYFPQGKKKKKNKIICPE